MTVSVSRMKAHLGHIDGVTAKENSGHMIYADLDGLLVNSEVMKIRDMGYFINGIEPHQNWFSVKPLD